MKLLNLVPVGIYAVCPNDASAPTSLRFVYTDGSDKVLNNYMAIKSNMENYVAPLALNLKAIRNGIPRSRLVVFQLAIDSWGTYVEVLQKLRIRVPDLCSITAKEYSMFMRDVPHKVRTLSGSFKYFVDTIKWFNFNSPVYEPFKLTDSCTIDIAPSQFKVVLIGNTPVCYWNTGIAINSELRSKVDIRETGIIINALETKQVLTMEMSRHKFVSVGEQLTIDFKTGACIRAVGTVNSEKTVHIFYRCVFDTASNLWKPCQDSIEVTKILGMRSV